MDPTATMTPSSTMATQGSKSDFELFGLILEVTSGLRHDFTVLCILLASWMAFKALNRRIANVRTRGKDKAYPLDKDGKGQSKQRRGQDGRRAPKEAEALFDALAKNKDSVNKTELSDTIVRFCAEQWADAVGLYKQALDCGVHFSPEGGLPQAEAEKMYTELCLSSIRVGKTDIVTNVFLRDMRRYRVPRNLGLYASIVRMSAAKRQFKDVLVFYDHVVKDCVVNDDRTVWSCCLAAAVEEKAWNRCPKFYEELKKCGSPSSRDYANMVRALVAVQNPMKAVELLMERRKLIEAEKGENEVVKFDHVLYNTVLACCSQGGLHMEEAEKLLAEMEAHQGAVDVITFNTMMKGYLQAKQAERCFTLVDHMHRQHKGMEATQVTYGILLDACNFLHDAARTAQIFKRMREDKCSMNTVLYTTLIKGFVHAGDVNQALDAFDQMGREGIARDKIAYSVLMKALCDSGGVDQALLLLNAMDKEGHAPDEIIFNTLLSGARVAGNKDLAQVLLSDMMGRYHLSPSKVTVSILLKLYAQCDGLVEAVDLVTNMQSRFGIHPERRLYVQLVHDCLRARAGSEAVSVYRLMCEKTNGPAAEDENSKAVRSCAKTNLLDIGVEFVTIVLHRRGKIEHSAFTMLKDSCVRKKKERLVVTLQELAQAHGINV